MPRTLARQLVVVGAVFVLLVSWLTAVPAAGAAQATEATPGAQRGPATAEQGPAQTSPASAVVKAHASAGAQHRSQQPPKAPPPPAPRASGPTKGNGASTPTGIVAVPGGPLFDLAITRSGVVFGSNPSRNEIEVLDLATGTLETPIAVGSRPEGIGLSLDGSALYVADAGSSQITVVTTATRAVTGSITIPPGTLTDTPFSVAVANNGKLLVATNFSGSGYGARLLEIDLKTDAATPLGMATDGTFVAASADGSHIGVVFGDDSGGPVYLYTAATDTLSKERDLNAFVSNVALNANGSQVLVNGFLLDQNLSLDGTIPAASGFGEAFAATGTTAYASENADVQVVDTSRMLETATIALPESVGTSSGAMVVSPDGSALVAATSSGFSIVAVASAKPVPSCTSSVTGATPGSLIAHICGAPLADMVADGAGHVFASNPALNQIEVLDTLTGVLERPIPVGSEPIGLDLSASGSLLYVADAGGDGISVVNVAQRAETARIHVVPPAFTNDSPYWISVANNGTALLSTTFAGSGFGARLFAINLATFAVSQRTDFYYSGTTTEDTQMAASGDRSHIALVAGDISSGPVFVYRAATDSFTKEFDLNAFVDRPAMDVSGSQILVDPGSYYLSGAPALQGTIPGGGRGLAFGPDGTTAYRVQDTSVDIIDLVRQLVIAQLALPEPVAYGYTAVVGADLAVTTQSGISMLPLTPAARATPSIAIRASGSTAMGNAISAGATISGGNGPTGTVSFQLFGPQPTAVAMCSGPAAFVATVPVSGAGVYQSGPFAPSSPGYYTWVANYSGDTNNNPVGPTACGGSSSTVSVGIPHATLTTLTSGSGVFPLAAGIVYQLVNDGGDPLTGVSVTDTGCGAITFAAGAGGPTGTLQPGATWFYSCLTTLEQPWDYSGNATASATDAETSQAAPAATAHWTLSARCGRVVTGTLNGDQTALPGSTCLVGADLGGNLLVPPGSSVYVGDSTVHGSIAAEQPNVFTLCGSTVNGSVGVVAATGPVTMAPISSGCGPNTVTSSIASLISADGVNITANQVGQKLLVWDARGPAATLSANNLGGDLWCANDVPLPTDAGHPNVVTGSRIGQCGAASF